MPGSAERSCRRASTPRGRSAPQDGSAGASTGSIVRSNSAHPPLPRRPGPPPAPDLGPRGTAGEGLWGAPRAAADLGARRRSLAPAWRGKRRRVRILVGVRAWSRPAARSPEPGAAGGGPAARLRGGGRAAAAQPCVRRGGEGPAAPARPGAARRGGGGGCSMQQRAARLPAAGAGAGLRPAARRMGAAAAAAEGRAAGAALPALPRQSARRRGCSA